MDYTFSLPMHIVLPIFPMLGFLCIVIALGIITKKTKSSLLLISTSCFFITLITEVLQYLMPYRFNSVGGLTPPAFLQWLSFIGVPILLFIAGFCLLLFTMSRREIFHE